jgi:hypothetical protein
MESISGEFMAVFLWPRHEISRWNPPVRPDEKKKNSHLVLTIESGFSINPTVWCFFCRGVHRWPLVVAANQNEL